MEFVIKFVNLSNIRNMYYNTVILRMMELQRCGISVNTQIQSCYDII